MFYNICEILDGTISPESRFWKENGKISFAVMICWARVDSMWYIRTRSQRTIAICGNSSNIYLILWRTQILVLAFSTVLERLVSSCSKLCNVFTWHILNLFTDPSFYDIYTHISELHLANVGIDVNWSDIDVSLDIEEDRWGQSREYFSLPIYRLPIGKMQQLE